MVDAEVDTADHRPDVELAGSIGDGVELGRQSGAVHRGPVGLGDDVRAAAGDEALGR